MQRIGAVSGIKNPMKWFKWGAIFLLSWVWFSAVSWAMADEDIHQMLPLAVGNSWDYEHVEYYPNARSAQLVTLSITHTEDIERHTYYVFSDMPYEEPPVPYFFLAGKKVRWEGNHLLFRQQDRDVALYQFQIGDQEVYYPISKTNSDTLVLASPLPTYGRSLGWPTKAGCVVRDELAAIAFYFIGHKVDYSREWPPYSVYEVGRDASFLEGFGMIDCNMIIRDSQGNPIGGNNLFSLGAVIRGVPWDFWNNPKGKASAGSKEFPCLPTAAEVSSWGILKQQFTSSEGGD